MNIQSQIPREIVSMCERCADAFSGTNDVHEMIKVAGDELSQLSQQKKLFAELLLGAFQKAQFPDIRLATMFDNELLLYYDPVHKFSLRAFLWAPGQYTDVHDHGSWGVIGPVTGKLEVINYERGDDGLEEGKATLVEDEMIMLEPGETTFTLPLNDGIHEVGNPTDETILSLSLYGRAVPRGYILGFDVAEGRCYRIVAPQTKKKLLVAHALSGLDAAAGDKILKELAEHPSEIFRELSPAEFGRLS